MGNGTIYELSLEYLSWCRREEEKQRNNLQNYRNMDPSSLDDPTTATPNVQISTVAPTTASLPAIPNTPRRRAQLRQKQTAYLKRAFSSAVVGDAVRLVWRLVDERDEDRASARWIVWSGTVETVERDQDDDTLVAGSVRWAQDCEELETPVSIWPPAPVLQEVSWVFEVQEATVKAPGRKKPILRLAAPAIPAQRPTQIPTPPPPPTHDPPSWDDMSVSSFSSARDSLFEHQVAHRERIAPKRAREDPSDELAFSHALLDQAGGVKTPMISLTPGLRIPQHVEARWSFLYPHKWIGRGTDYLAEILRQHNLLGCTFRVFTFREMHDLDLEIMCELLDVSRPLRSQKEHWKVLFYLGNRIAGTLLHTSSLGGAAAAEGYASAFGKGFEEGRLDLASWFFGQLQKTATATTATTPAVVVDYDKIQGMVANAIQKGRLRSEDSQYAAPQRNSGDNYHQRRGRGGFQRRPWRGRN